MSYSYCGEPVVVGESRQAQLTQALRAKSGYRTFRSIADLTISAVALLLLMPILILIAVAVKLDSPGPVLFRQLRAGKDGKPFELIKFRSMNKDAPHFSEKKSEHDPEVTRVGRLLRRSGVDELPQLWNVVRGEMALIGPRPEQLALLASYDLQQLRWRHSVKPGITGWWQVHHRDTQPMRENIEKDLYYIQNMGIALDLVIAWRTLNILLSGLLRSIQWSGGEARSSGLDGNNTGDGVVSRPASGS
jgi:lipopolysaccharide/colanic/teichoic acid biosynthesis glycosyltransferase